MWYISSIKNNDDKNSCKTGMATTLSFIPQYANIKSTPKSTKNKTIQDAIYMVLEYETTLAYNKSPNSNSVYKKLNNKLTEEWSCIKQNYDIR